MKILILALFPILLSAQQLQPVTSVQADCQKFLSPIVVAGTFVSATVDNRQAACDSWVVTYSSFGFGTVSVLLTNAPLTTAGAAGTFVSYAGTIMTGFANPATATTQGEIRTAGATAADVYFPYVRVQIATTGAGILFAEFHGFKTNPNSGTGGAGGSGCPGTPGTPCVVDGPTDSGAAATKPPVMVAGIDDSANVRTMATNPGGAVELAAGSGPDKGDQVNFSTLGGLQVVANNGARSNSGFTVVPYVVAGDGFTNTFNRPFACTQRANVTLTTIGLTRIIVADPFHFIHICNLSLSFASPVDIQIVEGTQVTTACDTGSSNMTGLFRSVVAFDPSWGPLSALGETNFGDDICLRMSASVNGGGVVTYAILDY